MKTSLNASSKHHIKWDLRGLLSFIETRREVSFKQLLAAGPNGEHSLRHLLKKLKKLDLIEIPVQRDAGMRFVSSKYRLTEFARTGQVLPADMARVEAELEAEAAAKDARRAAGHEDIDEDAA